MPRKKKKSKAAIFAESLVANCEDRISFGYYAKETRKANMSMVIINDRLRVSYWIDDSMKIPIVVIVNVSDISIARTSKHLLDRFMDALFSNVKFRILIDAFQCGSMLRDLCISSSCPAIEDADRSLLPEDCYARLKDYFSNKPNQYGMFLINLLEEDDDSEYMNQTVEIDEDIQIEDSGDDTEVENTLDDTMNDDAPAVGELSEVIAQYLEETDNVEKLSSPNDTTDAFSHDGLIFTVTTDLRDQSSRICFYQVIDTITLTVFLNSLIGYLQQKINDTCELFVACVADEGDVNRGLYEKILRSIGEESGVCNNPPWNHRSLRERPANNSKTHFWYRIM